MTSGVTAFVGFGIRGTACEQLVSVAVLHMRVDKVGRADVTVMGIHDFALCMEDKLVRMGM